MDEKLTEQTTPEGDDNFNSANELHSSLESAHETTPVVETLLDDEDTVVLIKGAVEPENVVYDDQDLSVGARLQQAREKNGLTQRNIADKLHLEIHTIQALEENNYDTLPQVIFIQGYIRSYAKLLNIAPEPLLKKFFTQQKDRPSPELSFHHVENKPSSSRDIWFRTMTVAIIITLIVLVVMWWQSMEPSTDQNEAVTAPDTTAQPVDEPKKSENVGFWRSVTGFFSTAQTAEDDTPLADTENTENTASAPKPETAPKPIYIEHVRPAPPTVVAPPVAPAPETNVAVGQATETTASPVLPSVLPEITTENTENQTVELSPLVKPVEEKPATIISDKPEAAKTTEQTAEQKPSQAGFVRVQLTANGSSWLEVKDAQRKRLYMGTVKTGEELNLEGAAPVSVVMGRPDVLNIKANGAPLSLNQFTEKNRVARFNVTEAGGIE